MPFPFLTRLSGLSNVTAISGLGGISANPVRSATRQIGAAKLNQQRVLNIPAALKRRLARSAVSSLLILADIVAYLASYSLLLPYLSGTSDSVLPERIFALAALAVIGLNMLTGLYPGYRLHEHEHLRRRVTVFTKITLLSVVGSVLLLDGLGAASGVIPFLGLGLFFQLVLHRAARRLCRRLEIWGERAVILGDTGQVSRLMIHFTDRWQYGIQPEASLVDAVAFSCDRPAIALVAGGVNAAIADLPALRRKFDEVILLCDTPDLKVSGLQPADAGGEIGIRLARSSGSATPQFARRVRDLAIAVPALLILTPFILAAAAVIYAIDPGPVFFRQAREGLSGKPLRILKLRTMYQDAEKRLETLLRTNPAIRVEWETSFKLKKDPRILPFVGHILRSSSFDELPQLANVISGEMAIVGPRPFPEYHLRAMDGKFREKRRSITPGLTGLWQVSARSDADIKLQQQLDEFYIDNRSLWFDWHILIRTIPTVCRRNGAY